MKIKDLRKAIHENAVQKGFWDEERSDGGALALIHSELSEALEADREGDAEKACEEIADAIIRTFDFQTGMEQESIFDDKTIPELQNMVANDEMHAMLPEDMFPTFPEWIHIMHLNLAEVFLNNEPLDIFLLGVCDMCNTMEMDLEREIFQKMAINAERARLHGKRY